MSGDNAGVGIMIPNEAQRLQSQLEKAAKAQADNLAEKAAKDKIKEKDKRSYYSRVDGSFFVTKTGHKCTFQNGVYVTDKPSEIEELDELCDSQGNHLISATPVECIINDAKVLKDVSNGQGNVQQQVHTGGPLGSVGFSHMAPK